MLKTISFYITFSLFLAFPSQTLADEQRELKKFCMWKASAAQVIAMNRDIGLNETEIIGEFLKQQTAYNEQVIVLNLIDKIYGNYQYVTHDTIYSQTNKTCMRSFYIDRSSEVFLTQQLDDTY
ncbi:MAG: hypothetical protein ACRBDX_00695 [Gammaproteobacteria bacterium]